MHRRFLRVTGGDIESEDMLKRKRTELSKFLSYVLRHRPDSIELELDEEGWTGIDALLAGAAKAGRSITRGDLQEVVETNEKKRFAISADGAHIRASQGHSVEVELGYKPVEPPETLYHGTAPQFLDAIRRSGLKRMTRHHVHLSPDRETAAAVGRRKGRPVVLEVRAGDLFRAGHPLYVSENGVWLTDDVPPAYIRFPGA